MVEIPDIALFDVVMMKKEHPCSRRSRYFQIMRVGADIKIKCLGCGKVMMLSRDTFNHKLKKVVSHSEKEVPTGTV